MAHFCELCNVAKNDSIAFFLDYIISIIIIITSETAEQYYNY